MNRVRILPKLAWNGMKKGASTYLPYILATSFSVFIFFIFNAISRNEFMTRMPHAGYLSMLMMIGQVLLGIILVPFLFYTNNFLMKQRRRELGLYSILGLEKKHIGLVILTETATIFVLSMLLGMILAVVFSKLVFIILLNITKLSVETKFTADFRSLTTTLLFFGSVFVLNLFVNLFQVSKSNPAELFRSARQGEKQPKHLWFWAILGVLVLGTGYAIALSSKLDSNIFLNFFLAVALVIAGTSLLFSSGIIAFLRTLKRNKGYYYKKQNFVTVSGMLYRMRKSAASLSNICIFSTMVIITLLCTVSLYTGLDSITAYLYPYDANYRFVNESFTQRDEFQATIEQEAEANHVEIPRQISFEYVALRAFQEDSSASFHKEGTGNDEMTNFRILTLEDYNRSENAQETLNADEVLLLNTGKDLNFENLSLADNTFTVKKELTALSFDVKEESAYSGICYLVVKDRTGLQSLYDTFQCEPDHWLYTVYFDLQGKEADVQAFLDHLESWSEYVPGKIFSENRLEGEKEDASVLGGLLFLGRTIGTTFREFMVMGMYYKQLSEGYEDKSNFAVMQQVGMSDSEVKSTIRRQILTVFFLPLAVAVIHTGVGLTIVKNLLGTLNLYNDTLIYLCTGGVALVFAVSYGISYHLTAKAYYKIVRR